MSAIFFVMFRCIAGTVLAGRLQDDNTGFGNSAYVDVLGATRESLATVFCHRGKANDALRFVPAGSRLIFFSPHIIQYNK